ncbi:GNAT family N-acetyltransferase [Streptomyces sp. GC420]|uniref:GNAT family N-acetyltransferase n=1 Tax=Streptomyces sp. GC420 TaxID=2697568 RepID=UPI001414F188|nr:GNAT family N-acetyltransferase [Streptomyces sp. GC420]NBM21069.1 GNAT family N-acetyltransferase [Streptomyces sp. GC420]
MRMTTARLVLRPVGERDVPVVSRLATDPEVRRYLGGPVPGERLGELERGCVGLPGLFAVVRAADTAVLGTVRLGRPGERFGPGTEVSYQLLPEHWERGYAGEAVGCAVAWALTGAHRVVAVTQEANTRSRRLLETVGLRLADSFEQWGAPQVMYSVERRRGTVAPTAAKASAPPRRGLRGDRE